MNNRDRLHLTGIIRYCDQITMAIERYGDDYSVFKHDCIYQNACCMCIIQIGEMANGLSQEVIESMPDIPWKQIRGMRNEFAHNYGRIDLPTTWNTLRIDIPLLRNYIIEKLNAV